jgi:N-acetylglucosaminyldiphosphoundecaprenol N-acetyl-beta-D-mannosaminyltransferase
VQTRAPAWAQRVGLEHLYRLLRQPWRWRRQVDVYRFGLLALLASLKRRINARVSRAIDKTE